MIDLTTLTLEELNAEFEARSDEYKKVKYSLTAATASDIEMFPEVLEPGGVKLDIRASYNYELTEAHVSATAYVEESSADGSFSWRVFFMLFDRTLKSEAEVRYLAYGAIETYRKYVEILREMHRRAVVRRAAEQALIEIPIAVGTEYI